VVRVANALLICSLAALPASVQTSAARAQSPKVPPDRPTASHQTTSHLTIDASASESQVAPGSRVSLMLDIAPRRRMHVYAPGATGYRVIELAMSPAAAVTYQPLKYPPSEIYEFEPLQERVPVYQKPFQLVQAVVIDGSPKGAARLRRANRLIINGTLSYQACDDRVCFAPASVPVSWTFTVK
jgi:Disulphide bond corrector protein DsbC